MEHSEKSSLRKKARKIAIVLLLLGSLWPPLATNIGLNAQTAGWSGALSRLNQPYPTFGALLLCQVWALFAAISPFNYTLQYEVELTDGQVLVMRDFQKEAAGKWQTILFHNEPKTELNLYSDRNAMRNYMEYLIRTNGLDPAWVVRRTILVRYRNVLSREQAALAHTYYGPEAISVLDNY